MIEQKHIDQAARNAPLGPVYFSARDAVEKFMAEFQAEQFEPLLKKASDDFYSRLLDDVQNYLLANAQDNLQGEIWRTVDQIVGGILSGERWIMERYALGPRYDCDKARAAVAKHIPKELQDARVTDLEAE